MKKEQRLPLSELTALSPLDGRYREQTEPLAKHLSEFGLIRSRLQVEVSWLGFLSEQELVRKLSAKEKLTLKKLPEDFSISDAEKVKGYEQTTRHDVKALEYFIRDEIKDTNLSDIVEFIHFGLTSEDVNNLAYRLMLKRATEEVMLPEIDGLVDDILDRAQEYRDLPMLGRTHGQPAIPTTLGKELVVFAIRLNSEARVLEDTQLTGKVTGAVGSYNALSAAFPRKNWIELSKRFVKSLDLKPNIFTTQINPYEDIISLLQTYQRINGIVLDFDQDMWRYISDNWFVQVVKKDEVGSSTMPQKVNPIRFENSEGNAGLANSLIEHFTRKLPVSRLQRDLSDSTVVRNVGSTLGYSLLAYTSSRDGLSRLRANEAKIEEDLSKDWSILAEGVQTILRKAGRRDPYTLIKSLTRGEHITKELWEEWVDSLPVANAEKGRILKLTPENYIGLSPQIVDEALKEISSTRKKP